MRRQTPQLSLNCVGIDHDHAKELAQIDLILDDNPRIKELVEQDLFRGLSNPETGRKVRIDSTVVETNIYYPNDSRLLFDGVRVLTRILRQLRELGCEVSFSNHIKRAKRRMPAISNARLRSLRISRKSNPG